jgi:hypothetical protein
VRRRQLLPDHSQQSRPDVRLSGQDVRTPALRAVEQRVTPPIGRAFAIGLAAGLLWLITVSLGFGILNVALIHVTRATRLQLFAVLAFVSGVLSFSAIRVLRRARRLPTGSTAAGKARGKRMGMWFGIIFGLEGMIIGIASTVLGATHHGELIVPVAILVVGLHCLPLAWLFEVPATTDWARASLP